MKEINDRTFPHRLKQIDLWVHVRTHSLSHTLMNNCFLRGFNVEFCQETQTRLLFGGIETSPSISQLLTQYRDVHSWDFSHWAERWEGKSVTPARHHEEKQRHTDNIPGDATFSDFPGRIQVLSLFHPLRFSPSILRGKLYLFFLTL